jgi:hypothetical protein
MATTRNQILYFSGKHLPGTNGLAYFAPSSVTNKFETPTTSGRFPRRGRREGHGHHRGRRKIHRRCATRSAPATTSGGGQKEATR